MTRLALGIGLTKLDPSAWDGWAGDCPGCDRDVATVLTDAHGRKFDGLDCKVNALANMQTLGSTFDAASAILDSDDLLLLYASCHGTWRDDESGDESDGRDEGLCLWDGELWDDVIVAKLNTLKHGVRVWLVTDSCHSGTVHRGRPTGMFSTPKYHSPLLHWGGCEDSGYSYGADKGGVFTLAWHKVVSKARKPLTYSEVWERILIEMDGERQRPQMVVEGGFDLGREAWT